MSSPSRRDIPERVDRRARVVALHQKGLSLREIGRQVGVSYESVRADLTDAGIVITSAIPARREKVAELFEAGLQPGQIAARLKVTERVIRNDLSLKGIKTKPIKAKSAKLPTPNWESIDQETTALLIDAARLGSVSAAITLQRIGERKAKVAVEAACETHVDLSVAGEMLLTCAEVYRNWISRIPNDTRLDGFKPLLREIVEEVFAKAHLELTRTFSDSETKAAVLRVVE